MKQKLIDNFRTLLWINKIRREESKRPLLRIPKGEKNAAANCPVARALGGDSLVCSSIITLSDGETDVTPPEVVSAWINRFDAGGIPSKIA